MIIPLEQATAWLREVKGSKGLLALDVSRRTIGLAGADPGWQLATPIGSIRRTRLTADLDRLRRAVDERAAEVLVVGWPLTMEGREGPRCQSIRAFARDTEAALGRPVVLWDERLTSYAADEIRGAADKRRRAPDRDALAAAVILQDLLDRLAREDPPAAAHGL